MNLVGAVKQLQLCAQGQQKLSDKDLEARLQEVRNVVQLGFQMPANMAISLMQILARLCVEVDISKDFLHAEILALLTKVALTCDKLAFTHEVTEMSALEIVKWSLVLVKDTAISQKITPNLLVKYLETCELLVQKDAFDVSPLGVGQILPAVSSVCVKGISQDYKTSVKVR